MKETDRINDELVGSTTTSTCATIADEMLRQSGQDVAAALNEADQENMDRVP